MQQQKTRTLQFAASALAALAVVALAQAVLDRSATAEAQAAVQAPPVNSFSFRTVFALRMLIFL